MEIHQLRYFTAVARAQSFSRAAQRCFVSQPSLSQQIAKLERSLGQRLFDRLGRRVVLTEAGRVLLDRAESILSAVEETERRLRDRNATDGGRVTVGILPTIAPYLLGPALKRFFHPNSATEVTIQEDVTAQLVAGAAAGDLDLAIVALPIGDERLTVEHLFTEPLFLVLPPDHRFVRKRNIRLEDLRDDRFIVLNEMHCLGEQVLSVCRASGCEPKIACRSAQISTIQSLIALGQGISLLPAMARRAERGKQRVYCRLAGEQPTRTIAAIWHRHRYHSQAAERFLAGLREVAREFEALEVRN
jgi:LysR family hydrogen peroxide-inducible transcriptional activator